MPKKPHFKKLPIVLEGARGSNDDAAEDAAKPQNGRNCRAPEDSAFNQESNSTKPSSNRMNYFRHAARCTVEENKENLMENRAREGKRCPTMEHRRSEVRSGMSKIEMCLKWQQKQ
eukprot:11144945-Ditylum_brightwellii.AAC.1